MGTILTIFLYIGFVIGSLVGAYVIFMLIMALGPRKPVPEQPLEKEKKKTLEKEPISRAGSKKMSASMSKERQ
ncbi:MAG: hypothetical protein JSV17_12350 [Candidatus Aminicenantes bacterium]|nr:MAG: hypothetical protein JSV17_12350 [Candidatus Aminicenantes bacterium]